MQSRNVSWSLYRNTYRDFAGYTQHYGVVVLSSVEGSERIRLIVKLHYTLVKRLYLVISFFF